MKSVRYVNAWRNCVYVLAICGFFTTAKCNTAVAQSKSSQKLDADGLAIPEAAYHRELGVIPQVRKMEVPKYAMMGTFAANDDTTAPAVRGLPLGGIGAGAFEVNQGGTFGPWYLGHGAHEQRILPQAAFHLRAQVEGEQPNVVTLATRSPLGSVLPSWPMLAPGQATYDALYPFGWMTYRNASTQIRTRFWSPIVAKNDERTSMPVAYFDVEVSNRTNKNSTISVMFTFPNAPIHVLGTGALDWMSHKPETVPASTRIGLASRFDVEAGRGIYLHSAYSRHL